MYNLFSILNNEEGRQCGSVVLGVEQDGVVAVCGFIACVEESVVLIFVSLQPVGASHGVAVTDGDDAEFVLAWAGGVERERGLRRALLEGGLEGSFQFVSKRFLAVGLRLRYGHKDGLLVDAGRVRRCQRPFVVAYMELDLVVVELQIDSALLYNSVGEGTDFLFGLQFLLQLGDDVHAQHLLVTVGFLVVLGAHNLCKADVKGIADVVDADVGGKAAKVDEGRLWQDGLAQLCCDAWHFCLVEFQFHLKFLHDFFFAHLDDGSPHVFDALVHFPLSTDEGLSFGDGTVDDFRESADVCIHVLYFVEQFESEIFGKLESHCVGSCRVEVGQICLVPCVDAVAYIGQPLQKVEVAPFGHVGVAVVADGIDVFVGLGYLFFDVGAEFGHFLNEEFRHFEQFHDADVARLPAFEEFVLDVVANFTCHVWDGFSLSLIVGFHAHASELLGKELLAEQ